MAKRAEQIEEAVRERYSGIARELLESGASSSCCDDGCCGGNGAATLVTAHYSDEERATLPEGARLASLGCGNPTALTTLHPGEHVLDLGSGGGIDVILSARRVGPTGVAYGLDMTDEMLELARRNGAEAGVDNVHFLKGDIAQIPLPDNSVDVIISNCVINLAVDKEAVYREAFRVLRPGGRLAISDIVIHGGLPLAGEVGDRLRRDLGAWAGCVAGAMSDDELRTTLEAAGFEEIELEATQRYSHQDLPREAIGWAETLGVEVVRTVMDRFASTFIRARKPS